MINKGLIFSVFELLAKDQGTKEIFEINLKPDLGADFNFKSNLKAKILLMALQDEIHIEIRDLEVKLKRECDKCLQSYSQKIKIDLISAEFLLEPSGNYEDYFLIDRKEGTIDLTEMLRQEILLHFPLVSVCSNSCKGLCQKCGTNLNKKECDCKIEHKVEKPFAILKQFKSR